MSNFNSLCCTSCRRNPFSQSPCEKEKYWLPVACQNCANIRCRHGCSDNSPSCCGTAMKVYKPLTDFIFLLNSPLEEVNRITFEVCTSSSCIKCGASEPVYRRSIREVLCEQCCDVDYSWPITSPLEALYLKLFADVQSVASVYYPDRSMSYTTHTFHKFSLFPTCSSCKEPCEIGNNSISCSDCCLTLDAYDCLCLIAFMRTLECIPLKYLPSLNYETWTNAFHCSNCKDRYKETYKRVVIHLSNDSAFWATPIHEMLKGERVPNGTTLNLVQALGTKYLAGWSRSTRPTQSSEPNMRLNHVDTREQSNYNDLPPSSTQFPIKITCKCGRVDELKDMFDCLTCSEYGICGVCGLRNHKKHEIEETTQSVMSTVVSDCSGNTLERISKWAEEYRQLNTECEANYAKLCELLGATFKEALTCGDFEQITDLLSECDISHVEILVKDLLKKKKETTGALGEVCARLQRRLLAKK